MARLVAIRAAPAPAFLEAAQRCWDAGDAVLPVARDLHATALTGLLEALRPAVLLDGAATQVLGDSVPVEDEVALVVPTSGSTGKPKGVELTTAALDASAVASLRRLDATTDDRWLCCLPLHHVAGLQVVRRARRLGHEPILLDAFDAERVANRREATHVSLVPTMLHRLLDAQVDLSHLRCVLLGGAPPPPALLARAASRDLNVVITYGMTETCGGCVYDGLPLDGVGVRIDQDGAVLLRGDMLFSGYRMQPGRFGRAVSDGWLRTDDLGRLVDGRLEIWGRADDIIISGGENVSTVAVTDALTAHPAVAEAAAVGVADPEWGQRVVAFVVADSAEIAVAELRTFVQRRLGAAAAPREIVVVAELPHLANGKVDRLTLARRIGNEP